MTDALKPVIIYILGKEYKIACPPEERNDLMNNAQILDEQMRKIQDAGKVIGADRIAVLAALNLAHELSQLQKQNADWQRQVDRLRHKIDDMLQSA